MKEQNPIDELFKRGLDNKEIKPSDAAWSKIEEAMMPEDSKKGGFYFMRAAVVTLLIGLSSWVYINNNPLEMPSSTVIPATTIENNPSNISSTDLGEGEPKKGASTSTGTQNKLEKENTGKKVDPKRIKPRNPIMKRSGGSQAKLVNISPATEDFRMMDHDMFVMDQLVADASPISKKIKIKVPVTVNSFYNEVEEEKEPVKKLKFKERVFAYASDQFDNLISGEPLELPKTDISGRPKLEISLGKFLTKE